MEAMSQDELQKKYEAELLKEKYGDDYEKMRNSTYKDYMKEKPENNNTQPDKQSSNNNSSSSYAGPALVYVELENPNRGKSYIHVPVFTCRITSYNVCYTKLLRHDMLGITQEFSPRFLRRYASLDKIIGDAVVKYIEDVKNCDFPDKTEQY